MSVNLPFLLFAIFLLWFPRQWMRQGLSIWNRRKQRSERVVRRTEEPWNVAEPGDPAVRFGAEFKKLRNYVDVLRAAAGSVANMGGFGLEACVETDSGTTAMLAEVLALKIASLLVGLLIQTVRYERQRLLFFAPIFYLLGLSVGLCGGRAALFAFALVCTVNPMLKNPQGFLAVYAVTIGAFGYFFADNGAVRSIVAVVFFLLPVLLSMLADRPLVLFSRRGTRMPSVPS